MSAEDKKLIAKLKKLPTDYWDFRNDDTKAYTHGIHNYPAMMVCPISRNIIKLVKDIRPVRAIFDPFAGSGTVLVEGMLSGIGTVAGNDINPLALLLTEVKTTPISDRLLGQEIENLLEDISSTRTKISKKLETVDSFIIDTLHLDITNKKGWGENAPKYLKQFCINHNLDIEIPNFKNIGYWFKPRVILELAIIKAAIERISVRSRRNFMFVAMSECIRLVSNRRNGEFKMFRIPAEKVKAFNPNVYNEFKKILLRNYKKMHDFNSQLSNLKTHSKVSIFSEDACSLKKVPNNTYDLVITSPPYGDSRTTVAYGEYSRLSMQWINLSQLTEKEIMGVDKSLMGGKKYKEGFHSLLNSATLEKAIKKIKKLDIERAGDVYSFYNDLDKALKSIADKTCRGGYQFWVVGNRTVKQEYLQTDVIITELAPRYGLKPVYNINRNIPNKVMPSLNSPTNKAGVLSSTMTTEHIVVLRKD